MNPIRIILTGSTFKYENGFFVDHEEVTICNENTISYYNIINFYVNASLHTITDRKECDICKCGTSESMYEYDRNFIHYSCYEIVKKILINDSLFNVKLSFVGDIEKEITLYVYGILDNHFIISNGHTIEIWSIGYGRPCYYDDFHSMLGNLKLSCKHLVGIDECNMCFEEGDVYTINDNVYCESCIHFISVIQNELLNKYILFNFMIKDIRDLIFVKLIEIYESII